MLTVITNRYRTAESCSTRMTEMGHSLTDMIEEINHASSRISPHSGTRPDDPLAQIVRVLNSHLVQLQNIDAGASDLQKKVEQAQREQRVLSERSGVGSGGWLEEFGRSYLGRR